eukprot:SAG22_NODE_755_length_7442_cov_2.270598_3_plen_301_part_00
MYSEDPRLSAALTVGYVTGIQGSWPNGTQKNPKYMRVGACCKHYVAYDIEGNSNYKNRSIQPGSDLVENRVFFDAKVDTRSFWEHYMPVFHDCVVSAKAMHVMCSYNMMNGVPTCGDPNLLNGVLRRQWGWDGFVVSDYDAWRDIFTTHQYTDTMEAAAAVGINAGLDQEGGGTLAISQLEAAAEHGLTNVTAIQMAFRRLMRMRIRLGMFDPPTLLQQYNELGEPDLQTAASTALNRRAAAAGMVLLKNGMHQGNPLLPLDVEPLRGVPGSMLVAGPTANNANNSLVSTVRHCLPSCLH